MTITAFESVHSFIGDRAPRAEHKLRKFAARVFQQGGEQQIEPPQPLPTFHDLKELAVGLPHKGDAPQDIVVKIDETARRILERERQKLPQPDVAEQKLYRSSLDATWCALQAWDMTHTDQTKELVEFELEYLPGIAKGTLDKAFSRALAVSKRGTFDDALEQEIAEQRQAA